MTKNDMKKTLLLLSLIVLISCNEVRIRYDNGTEKREKTMKSKRKILNRMWKTSNMIEIEIIDPSGKTIYEWHR